MNFCCFVFSVHDDTLPSVSMLDFEIESNANFREISRFACLMSSVVTSAPIELPNARNLSVIDLTESPISTEFNTTFSPAKKIETIAVDDETFTEETTTEQIRVAINNLTFSPKPNDNNSQTNTIMPMSKSVIDDLVAEPSGVRDVECEGATIPSKMVPYHFGNRTLAVGYTKEFRFKMQSTSTPMPVFRKFNKGEFY